MKLSILFFFSFLAGAQTIGELQLKLNQSISGLQAQFDLINKELIANKVLLTALKNCKCDQMILDEITNGHVLVGVVTFDPIIPDALGQILTILPTPLVFSKTGLDSGKILYDGFGQSNLKQYPFLGVSQ